MADTDILKGINLEEFEDEDIKPRASILEGIDLKEFEDVKPETDILKSEDNTESNKIKLFLKGFSEPFEQYLKPLLPDIEQKTIKRGILNIGKGAGNIFKILGEHLKFSAGEKKEEANIGLAENFKRAVNQVFPASNFEGFMSESLKTVIPDKDKKKRIKEITNLVVDKSIDPLINFSQPILSTIPKNMRTKIGTFLSRFGNEIGEQVDKEITETALPDPELNKGTFMENPSWRRAVNLILESSPTLVLAGTITMMSGSPFAGGAVLGALEGSDIYDIAREKGASHKEAAGLAGMKSLGIALLEQLPLGILTKGVKGNVLVRMLKSGAAEGIQEGTQTILGNVIEKFGVDFTKDWLEGLTESIIAGAGSGFGMGSFAPGIAQDIDIKTEQVKEVIKDLDVSKVIDEIGDEVSKDKDKVEDILAKEMNKTISKSLTEEAEPAIEGQEGIKIEERLDELSKQKFMKDRTIEAFDITKEKLKSEPVLIKGTPNTRFTVTANNEMFLVYDKLKDVNYKVEHDLIKEKQINKMGTQIFDFLSEGAEVRPERMGEKEIILKKKYLTNKEIDQAFKQAEPIESFAEEAAGALPRELIFDSPGYSITANNKNFFIKNKKTNEIYKIPHKIPDLKSKESIAKHINKFLLLHKKPISDFIKKPIEEKPAVKETKEKAAVTEIITKKPAVTEVIPKKPVEPTKRERIGEEKLTIKPEEFLPKISKEEIIKPYNARLTSYLKEKFGIGRGKRIYVGDFDIKALNKKKLGWLFTTNKTGLDINKVAKKVGFKSAKEFIDQIQNPKERGFYTTQIEEEELRKESEIMFFDKKYVEKYIIPKMQEDYTKTINQGFEKEDAEIMVKYAYGIKGLTLKFKKVIEKYNAIDRLKARLIKEQTRNEISKQRRIKIRAIKEHFGLTDVEIRKINRKDLRLMTDEEYINFVRNIEEQAYELAKTKQKRNELLNFIEEMKFNKIDNVRKALQFPDIRKMENFQIDEMMRTLEPFEVGDEFLTVRMLETIDNTDLKGVRTIREIRENLAKKIGISPDKLDLKVGVLDKFRYDTSLAQKAPFYKMMVEETAKAEMKAQAEYLKNEREFDRLIRNARKSRKKSIVEKLIPTDTLIFDWLESKQVIKQELQKRMTEAEMKAAYYLDRKFEEMRDRLIEKKVLENYRENYITHVQRGFLETVKEDGLIIAFKEVFKQNEQQQTIFEIIDDTGKILPLEKFIPFVLQRTGELTPTKNVAKAFNTYNRAFQKKEAFDSIIPMIEAYSYSLQKRDLKTPRGLEIDTRLKNFVKRWINTKKGRAQKLMIGQGDKLDTILKAGNAAVTLIDLGLNIPIGLASQVGEQSFNWVMLGSKRYMKGVKRFYTKKGRNILKRYENFTGRTIIQELKTTSTELGEKLNIGIYGLFHDANSRANKIFLLGSLTDLEFNLETISDRRLAKLKVSMGRYRMTTNSNSIIGKTPEGKIFTKYKTWAVPALYQTLSNIKTVSKMLSKGEFKKTIKSLEFQELFRTSLIGLVVYTLLSSNEDEKDRTFIDKILTKVKREAMSGISALNPKMWKDARLRSFVANLTVAIDQLLKLERYKRTKELKGIKTLKKTLTPTFVKHIEGILKGQEKKPGKKSIIP